MAKNDFTKMSNAEINIKMMALENEFEIKRAKVNEMLRELVDINTAYLDAKTEIKKRKGNGFVNG
jgi:hypothetical protein